MRVSLKTLELVPLSLGVVIGMGLGSLLVSTKETEETGLALVLRGAILGSAGIPFGSGGIFAGNLTVRRSTNGVDV